MEFASDGPMAIPMWVNGHAFLTVTKDFFTVTNPQTGEAIRRVPLCAQQERADRVLRQLVAVRHHPRLPPPEQPI